MSAMPTAAFYRAEADRLRVQAEKAQPADTLRWLKLATEYDQLADSLEAVRADKPVRTERPS